MLCTRGLEVVLPLKQWNSRPEMGVDGQGNTEPGGSNDDKIFFMKYPYPFLQYWYGIFPLTQQETIPTTRQLFLPHLLMWSQTYQGKAFREMLGSHTCPQARLLSSNTGLLYPMTSSLLAEILEPAHAYFRRILHSPC